MADSPKIQVSGWLFTHLNSTGGNLSPRYEASMYGATMGWSKDSWHVIFQSIADTWSSLRTLQFEMSFVGMKPRSVSLWIHILERYFPGTKMEVKMQ